MQAYLLYIFLCTLQVSDLIIPTSETARQVYFLQLYLTHEIPLLFVGPTGTGKSAITNGYLINLPKDTYDSFLYLVPHFKYM